MERFNVAESITPSMFSEMSENTIVSQDLLQAAMMRRMVLTKRLSDIYEELGASLGSSDVEGAQNSPENNQLSKAIEEAFANADIHGHGTISEQRLVKVFESL